ncbi:MAG: Crp/Fnr family transcriptional regulator [Pseudomonadota bacterium]
MTTPASPTAISATPPDCLADAAVVSLPAGAPVFHAGDPCSNFYYLLDGSIRVDLVAASGKAVLLYRFGAGQTCVLTTSCLLSGDDYSAEATVEEDARACVLPMAAFQEKLNASADFRAVVFGSFSQRLAAMMGKVEDIAFTPIETRLAERLLNLAGDALTVSATHDRLAADLGTSREVVSRKLAKWEKSGLIERGRGAIAIVDAPSLKRLTAAADPR